MEIELTPRELLTTTRTVRKRLDLTRPVERDIGTAKYLTEHWNTWYAHRVLFDNFDVEPAHPNG